MKELETILGYIEEGRNRRKAEKLLRDRRWQVEKGKLEKLLGLLRRDKGYEEECPDFEEVVRFYYHELPPDRREAFIGHLMHCRGLCIEALRSLRESERKASEPFEGKAEGILEELWDKGLISEELLAYINVEGPEDVQIVGANGRSPLKAQRLKAYDFLQRYGAAVLVLSIARVVRRKTLKAGGEDVQSVVKESDDFQVEIYPSPDAPGRLEAEISLKHGVEKTKYEGAELLVFVQAGEAMLSGIGVMKDGQVSGLALGGDKVGPGVFGDPERIKIELYIGG